ncbi:hypothetical protein WA158_005175 [Blastocystis sp. Blastoise]
MFILKYFEVYRLFTSVLVEKSFIGFISANVLFYIVFSNYEQKYGSIIMLYRFLVTVVTINIIFFGLVWLLYILKGKAYQKIWYYSLHGYFPVIISLFINELRGFNTVGSALSQSPYLLILLAVTFFLMMDISTFASILTGVLFYFVPRIMNVPLHMLLKCFPPVLIQLITSSSSYIGFSPSHQSGIIDDKTKTLLQKKNNINTVFKDIESPTFHPSQPFDSASPKNHFKGQGHTLG